MIFIPLRFLASDELGGYKPTDSINLGVWHIQAVVEEKESPGCFIKIYGDDNCLHVQQNKGQVDELVKAAVREFVVRIKKDLRK